MKTLAFCFIAIISVSAFSQSRKSIELWPGVVPGETEVKHPAVQTDNISRDVIRLTDVTNPILEVFSPRKGK